MHLIADVPVSVFLSAGLDSGILAALAADVHQGIEGLTLGFDQMQGKPADEVPGACKVAQHYGVRHHVRYVTQNTFLEHRQHLLQHMDQPTIDGVNTYFVSQLARERGYKVALSGLGGDELFGGYPSFTQVPELVHQLGFWSQFPRLGLELRRVTAPLVKPFVSSKYASLLEFGGSWGGAYLLRRGLFMPWEVADILGSEMAREGWEKLASIPKMNALALSLNDPKLLGQEDFLRVSALEMHYYMRTQLLRDADWAGMAHSVEIRVPFVDMALLRQTAALRGSAFAPRKPAIGKALPKPLPDEVLQRKKSGFVVPLREWMMAETGPGAQRGLRAWAVYLYRHFQGQQTSEAWAHSAV